MERKIGEIFEHNDEWYQCIEGEECSNCYFNNKKCYTLRDNDNNDIIGSCIAYTRSDRKGVVFKKLEKVGEPYEHYEKFYQCYKLPMETEIRLLPNNCYPIGKDNLVEIEIKQKEDMEEKEPTYEELLHYYHSTVGLWAIDRNPQEVNFDWICKNAFQLGLDKTLPNFEKIGKNLKPFNLEASRSGKPVCTRDGRKARIICFDKKDEDNIYPIVCLVQDGETESLGIFMKDGHSLVDVEETPSDLMMLPEKKEGWAVIYKDDLLRTEKEARELVEQSISEGIRIEKIEWEE